MVTFFLMMQSYFANISPGDNEKRTLVFSSASGMIILVLWRTPFFSQRRGEIRRIVKIADIEILLPVDCGESSFSFNLLLLFRFWG